MATATVPLNSPRLQPNRRAALAQLTAGATITALLAAAMAAEPADPFPELERQFWRFYRWEGLPRDMEEDDPRIEAYSDGWQATAATIIATPAMGMVGIGTKVRVLMLEMTDGQSEYGKDLAQSLLADLDRLAGEAAHG